MATFPSPTFQNVNILGTSVEAHATISGGSIDNVTIGATTASTGKFTTLNATTATLAGGTINATSVGATTPSTVAATTLSASGTVSGAGFTSLLSPYSTAATIASTYTAKTDLASTSSGKGAALVGFLQSGTSATARTVLSKERDWINVADFGAVADYVVATDTGTDNTAAFLAAVNYIVSIGGGTIYLDSGNFLGNFPVITTSFIKIEGKGSWATSIYNVNNNPVFSYSNASGNITDCGIKGLSINNRNAATWTSADGIVINGSVFTNGLDYNTFKDLNIYQMRYGINISGRTIWNLWERVHVTVSGISAVTCAASDNCAQQTFIQCHFVYSAQYGVFVGSSAVNVPVMNWQFYATTIEHNILNGVRVTGAGAGIQGWHFDSCYMEDNATGISAGGSGGLQKANIFTDGCPILGLTINSCTLFGISVGTGLDYNIYINTSSTGPYFGSVFDNRMGVCTVIDVYWLNGVSIGKNLYTAGRYNANQSGGSLPIDTFVSASTAFNPVLSFGGNSVGIAYSNQKGQWIRHGNLVHFSLYISLTSKGTSTGNALISGLPVPSVNIANLFQSFSITADALASGVANPMARVSANASQINLAKFASGALAALTDTDFGASSAINISGSYLVL
jgi:hypothetical protein